MAMSKNVNHRLLSFLYSGLNEKAFCEGEYMIFSIGKKNLNASPTLNMTPRKFI